MSLFKKLCIVEVILFILVIIGLIYKWNILTTTIYIVNFFIGFLMGYDLSEGENEKRKN